MTDKEDKEEKEVKKEKKESIIGCPLCGRTDGLRPSGRCVECIFCGWSKCSI